MATTIVASVTVDGVEYVATLDVAELTVSVSQDVDPATGEGGGCYAVGDGRWDGGSIQDCAADLGDNVYEALDEAMAEAIEESEHRGLVRVRCVVEPVPAWRGRRAGDVVDIVAADRRSDDAVVEVEPDEDSDDCLASAVEAMEAAGLLCGTPRWTTADRDTVSVPVSVR